MTLALLVHPAIAHDIVGWMLGSVTGLIVWGALAIRADMRDQPTEGRHRRYTPEPPTCTVIDVTEQPPPVLFDQDVTA